MEPSRSSGEKNNNLYLSSSKRECVTFVFVSVCSYLCSSRRWQVPSRTLCLLCRCNLHPEWRHQPRCSTQIWKGTEDARTARKKPSFGVFIVTDFCFLEPNGSVWPISAYHIDISVSVYVGWWGNKKLYYRNAKFLIFPKSQVLAVKSCVSKWRPRSLESSPSLKLWVLNKSLCDLIYQVYIF